jgi:hypothetical protein
MKLVRVQLFIFGNDSRDGMRAYRVAWGAIASALICSGVVAAVLLVPATISVMVLVSAAAIDLGLRLAVAEAAAPDRRGLAADCARDGFAMVALAGYCAAIGGVAVWLLAFAVISAPPVLVLLSRWFGAWFATAEQLPADDLVPFSDLSADDLCRAWRRTCTALRQAETWHERLRIAARRQAYLDELERRRPEGFAAWLEAGPDTADPSMIFSTKGHRHRDE